MIYDPEDPDCPNDELQHGLVPGTLIEGIFGDARLAINANHTKESR
jgi:hypothetical protein